MQGGDRRCSRSPAAVWPNWGALWSVRTSWLPHVTTYGRSCTGLGCRCPVNDHDGVTGTGTAKGFELCGSDGLILRMWCLWVLPTHPMAPAAETILFLGILLFSERDAPHNPGASNPTLQRPNRNNWTPTEAT